MATDTTSTSAERVRKLPMAGRGGQALRSQSDDDGRLDSLYLQTSVPCGLPFLSRTWTQCGRKLARHSHTDNRMLIKGLRNVYA
jgi:hypothetical protein